MNVDWPPASAEGWSPRGTPPLASLRNQLEASTYDDTRESWTASIADMSIDHERLERLVTDLLLLARHDQGERLPLEPIDLGYLVRSELSKRSPVPGIDRNVDAKNVLVDANPDALSRVLRNLATTPNDTHTPALMSTSRHRPYRGARGVRLRFRHPQRPTSRSVRTVRAPRRSP